MMDSETLNEIQALKAMAKRADERIDAVAEYASALHRRVDGLAPTSRLDRLPAPVLTEQAIVDALKADPAMAGRVMARVAGWYSPSDRSFVQGAAYNQVDELETPDGAQRHALQSLAVALAAASYRG